jgi:hypothetical protein
MPLCVGSLDLIRERAAPALLTPAGAVTAGWMAGTDSQQLTIILVSVITKREWMGAALACFNEILLEVDTLSYF